MNKKIKLGQFFTVKNIFELQGFNLWWKNIPECDKDVILEPFAGANHIIKNLQDLNLINNFVSYDIEPKNEYVKKLDTLKKFPKGFNCIITNPPYLYKNSATKKNIQLKIPKGYSDLYEYALFKCLKNSSYVAAIVPESFITSDFSFKNRLVSVISLTYKDMFLDTEHPVCLAMFNPEINKNNNFKLYRNDIFLGDYNHLKNKKLEILLSSINKENFKICFNERGGLISFSAIDNIYDSTGIFFSLDNIFNDDNIKSTSRTKTKLNIYESGIILSDNKKLKKIVNRANYLISCLREETSDVFFTSFKSLRKDGLYRRRLDFETAKEILFKAIEDSLND